jgi:magnesium transporter
MKTHNIEIDFKTFQWIDVCNPKKEDLFALADKFDLDLHEIKDSLEAGHLPKYETQEQYKFMIIRAYTAENEMRVTNIQELSNKIAFFYDKEKVITIHRLDFDFLKDIDGKYTNSIDQFIIYIIKKMMETYEEPAEILNKKIDVFEKTIFLKNYQSVSLENLYFIKTQTRVTKKLLQFTQNTLNQMEANKHSKSALQDIKDKLVNLILTYDEVLEDANNLLHTYLSVNGQKNNQVMKLLTIFSAFFLPLTFIVGVYGMNFEEMPELKMKYGYYFVLVFMVIISLFTFYWFKSKKIM